MRTAKDVMTVAVISVTPNTPIDEAMAILIENKISGLPIVDDDGHLVGILTEADRLKMLRNQDAQTMKQVGDVMTRNVVSVLPDTPLHEVSDLLLSGAMRRVPVIDNGSVVGIVSRRDLVREMYGTKS